MPDTPHDRPPALAHLRYRQHARQLEGLDLERLFARIYDTNLWGSGESRSGLGSGVEPTLRLRTAIPDLLARLGASTLLDIPCGDFGWLSAADLGGISYIGADIVGHLVESNRARYGGPDRQFLRLDLTADPLPRADVVLCRDCLVHLSFANIRRALDNLRRSGSEYLLTTTFLDHDSNEDCADGDWRLLNLERPPFALPRPHAVVVEDCPEEHGAYKDKALGLWRVRDL